MDQRKHDILQALSDFVNQRPGFDWHNYNSMSSYRADYRPTLQARDDFHVMRRAMEWRDSITADDILSAAQSAYSGRLTITELGDRKIEIDYCAGQYFPVEFRNAACAVLSSVFWHYFRANGADDYKQVQKMARNELSAGIQRRWFN